MISDKQANLVVEVSETCAERLGRNIDDILELIGIGLKEAVRSTVCTAIYNAFADRSDQQEAAEKEV